MSEKTQTFDLKRLERLLEEQLDSQEQALLDLMGYAPAWLESVRHHGVGPVDRGRLERLEQALPGRDPDAPWWVNPASEHARAVYKLEMRAGLPVVYAQGNYARSAIVDPQNRSLRELGASCVRVHGVSRLRGEQRVFSRIEVTRHDAQDALRVWQSEPFDPDKTFEDYIHHDSFEQVVEVAEPGVREALEVRADTYWEAQRELAHELLEGLPERFETRQAYEAFCQRRGLTTSSEASLKRHLGNPHFKRVGARVWAAHRASLARARHLEARARQE